MYSGCKLCTSSNLIPADVDARKMHGHHTKLLHQSPQLHIGIAYKCPRCTTEVERLTVEILPFLSRTTQMAMLPSCDDVGGAGCGSCLPAHGSPDIMGSVGGPLGHWGVSELTMKCGAGTLGVTADDSSSSKGPLVAGCELVTR